MGEACLSHSSFDPARSCWSTLQATLPVARFLVRPSRRCSPSRFLPFTPPPGSSCENRDHL